MNAVINKNSELTRAVSDFLQWLEKEAIPCWGSLGLDEEGAAYEQLHMNGQPDLTSQRRVRVQARQMFVFSAAQANGWIDNGLTLISDLESYVHKYAKSKNSAIFAHILDSNNEVINESHDLYDVAFFLLAYGWRYHVFNDLKALDYANKLLEQINLELKGNAGGWQEGSYEHKLRRQNPHMHLFEAFLTLYSVTKDGKWLAKAGEIFCLFETRFYDTEHKVLREHFNYDWSIAEGELGEAIEPGHMLEWVWLLRQYSMLTGTPVDDYCEALYHGAMERGVDKRSNLIYLETSVSGQITKGIKRCWSITEWIKAAFAQATYAKNVQQYDYQQDALIAIKVLQSDYLKSEASGVYNDVVDEDNNRTSEHAPSSTLYHIVLAALEAKRYLNGGKDVF